MRKARWRPLLITASASELARYRALGLFENDEQPEAFSSIPASMWWGIATLTTVGYGDIYPQTALGKFCGSLIAILGIGLFALPAGILGSGFVEQIHRRRGPRQLCPHCGKDPEEPPGGAPAPG